MTEVFDLLTGTVQRVDAPPREAVLMAHGYAQGDAHPEKNLDLYQDLLVDGVYSIACGDFCTLKSPRL